MEFTVDYLRKNIKEFTFENDYEMWFTITDHYRSDAKKTNLLVAFIPDICYKGESEENTIEFRLDKMFVEDNSEKPIYLINASLVNYNNIETENISMLNSIFYSLDEALEVLCKKLNAMQIVVGDDYSIRGLSDEIQPYIEEK